MRDKKYYISLDDFERRVVVNCLNEMLSTPVIKCKKAPNKKCRILAERRNK